MCIAFPHSASLDVQEPMDCFSDDLVHNSLCETVF